MILKIENLEVNLKGVFRALLWTSIGVGLCKVAHNAGKSTALVIIKEQLKEHKKAEKANKETKVESK